MDMKKKAAHIADVLREHYPDACSLDSGQDYELLFAARLSAQCTDARVNTVTEVLFARYPTLEAFAEADMEELCRIIRPCGLFRTKARDIKLCAQRLITDFGGRVPDTVEELLTLPGVGRKIANLIVSDLYGKPAVVADTHCIRISNRLGLIPGGSKDPYKVELALSDIVQPQEQASLCHRFVHFGRDICTARSPKCGACPLADCCPSAEK